MKFNTCPGVTAKYSGTLAGTSAEALFAVTTAHAHSKPIYTVSGSICAWFKKTFTEWERRYNITMVCEFPESECATSTDQGSPIAMTVTKTPIRQRKTNVRYGPKANLAMIFAARRSPRNPIAPERRMGAALFLTRPSPAQADLVSSEPEVEKEFRRRV